MRIGSVRKALKGRLRVHRLVQDVISAFPKRNKYIFFGCPNHLMATYLRPVWEVLRDTPSYRFYVGLKPDEYKPGENKRVRETLPIPSVSLRLAKFFPWDLVVLADHGYYDFTELGNCPVVFTGHGISGKVTPGEPLDYMYGSKAFTHSHRPRYTRMFEFTWANKERAVRKDPRLEDVIEVVGSPLADDILDADDSRNAVRDKMGVDPGTKVVFVLSTWGEHSLLHTMGDTIIEEARRLMQRTEFRFIITAHPHDYRSRRSDGLTWEAYLELLISKGFFVRKPHESWIPAMVASDVLLTDHTSLAVYGALIGRPSVWVPVPDMLIAPNSILWQLREISPCLDQPSKLGEVLTRAITETPHQQLLAIRERITSFPGQSRERMRHELLRLLERHSSCEDEEFDRAVERHDICTDK